PGSGGCGGGVVVVFFFFFVSSFFFFPASRLAVFLLRPSPASAHPHSRCEPSTRSGRIPASRPEANLLPTAHCLLPRRLHRPCDDLPDRLFERLRRLAALHHPALVEDHRGHGVDPAIAPNRLLTSHLV